MGIIFGYSSPVTYPSLLVATSQARIESSNGSLEIAQIIKKGNANSLPTRYGDCFSAATDPSEPNSVLLAGQYHNTPQLTGWSPYLAKVNAASSR